MNSSLVFIPHYFNAFQGQKECPVQPHFSQNSTCRMLNNSCLLKPRGNKKTLKKKQQYIQIGQTIDLITNRITRIC